MLFDIKNSLKLALFEIKLKYRLTHLGPIWISINSFIIITALGYIWSHILSIPGSYYYSYLASGFTFWWFFNSTVSDSVDLFKKNKNLIINDNQSFNFIIFKTIFTNFIIYLHSLFFVVAFLFSYLNILISIKFHLFFLGLLINFFILFQVSKIISFLTTRYRDLANIISNLMTLMFFVTPIVWTVDSAKSKTVIYEYNPVYHLIEIVRQPLLGSTPLAINYIYVFTFLCFLIIFSFFILNRYEKRITFWI